MKKYILLALMLTIGVCLMAQTDKKTDANIFGHVVDKKTGEHLPYINIMVKGTSIGTATDATGHFHLNNLPTGKLTIIAQSIGYMSQEKIVDVEKGKMIELNFEIEEDAIMLNDVVVSANKNQTNRMEAPVVVGVISPKTFENTNSVCLAEGLNFQPGLRLETNCQNCGFQQVRINGLEGSYSQILIDGRAVSSALSQVYGLEQLPVNMIEKVEVIRGGGSAIFGSNAVAGTINILTREPQFNSLSLGNTTTLIGMKKADVNTTLNASVVSNDNKAGITIFAAARQRTPFDYDGDGFTEIGKINSKNVGFRGYLKTGNYTKLTVEYHTLDEFRRGGNKLSLPAHEADITEQTDHNIHCAGAKYDIFSKNSKHWFQIYSSLQNIKRKSYYGSGQDPNAYGNTKDFASVSGFQYVFYMDRFLFMPATLTTGIEYNYNSLYDESLGYNRIIEQKISIYSAFIQNEWKKEKLSFLIGGRIDKHNMIKNPIISPRCNIRYSPLKWMSMRAGYAMGFRAPQAFNEDLHIAAVGGEVSLISIDPELKPEKSHSANASIDFNTQWSKSAIDFLVEGFYTVLNDVFILEENGHDADGNLLLTRTNGSGAVVAGANFELKYIPTKKVEIQAGFTYQQSRYKQPEQWSETVDAQRRMFRTPDIYGFLTTYYSPLKSFDIALSGTYTGRMLIQHFAGYISEDAETISKPFFDMNLKLSYTFKIMDEVNLEASLGMKNIFNSYQNDFDQGELRDAGYIYGPSLPRSIYFGLKISL
ncbi:MAG: TonB-dependent receptor [Bacteroidales bacterium]|nr:TonB-dependent receptor [Bacteroidales bacterium]